jgi:hypothetical protein
MRRLWPSRDQRVGIQELLIVASEIRKIDRRLNLPVAVSGFKMPRILIGTSKKTTDIPPILEEEHLMIRANPSRNSERRYIRVGHRKDGRHLRGSNSKDTVI